MTEEEFRKPMLPETTQIVNLYNLHSECLSPRENLIFRRRFNLDGMGYPTLLDVGKEFGMSREGVRRVETRCLRKLKSRQIQAE